MKRNKENIRRYTIKRLSIGVVSVVSGIYVLGGAPAASAQTAPENPQVLVSEDPAGQAENPDPNAATPPAEVTTLAPVELAAPPSEETTQDPAAATTQAPSEEETTKEASTPSETPSQPSSDSGQVDPSQTGAGTDLEAGLSQAEAPQAADSLASARAALVQPMALEGEVAPLATEPLPIGDARIAGEVKLLLNSAARGNIKSGYSSQYGGISYADFNNRTVQLLDANGVVVKEMVTNNGDYNFTQLPYGTYTVRILEDPRYVRILDNTFAHKPYEFTVTVSETAKTNTSGNVLTLVGRPAKVTMETAVGTYNGSTTLEEYRGGISQVVGVNNNQTYTNIGGPIHTDILGEYLSLLKLPTLSQEEIDKGYVHVGWNVDGFNDKDTGLPILYTEEGVLNLRVPANDLVIRPVWDRVAHKVTFLTHSEFGSIE